jgi:hypothetical protein
MREVRLSQTSLNSESHLGLADLRGASWRPIDDDNERAQLRKEIGSLPDWLGDNKARLERLIAPDALPAEPPAFALDGPLLVDDANDPRWRRLDRARLTTDEGVYDEALVPFLADLARGDPHVARGLPSRIDEYDKGRAARLARGLLDRAGPALPEDVR